MFLLWEYYFQCFPLRCYRPWTKNGNKNILGEKGMLKSGGQAIWSANYRCLKYEVQGPTTDGHFREMKVGLPPITEFHTRQSGY